MNTPQHRNLSRELFNYPVTMEDNQETEELERKLDDIVAKDLLDFRYMWDIDTPVFPFQEEGAGR